MNLRHTIYYDIFILFSSDLAESKLAALNCLLECIRKYEPRHLEPHFKDIWNSCKQVRYRLNLTTQKVLSCRLRVYGCGIYSTQPKFFFVQPCEFLRK